MEAEAFEINQFARSNGIDPENVSEILLTASSGGPLERCKLQITREFVLQLGIKFDYTREDVLYVLKSNLRGLYDGFIGMSERMRCDYEAARVDLRNINEEADKVEFIRSWVMGGILRAFMR